MSKTQTEVLQPLVLLVQHDDIIHAHLFVIGYHHRSCQLDGGSAISLV